MPRRPAMVTQADVARTIRAAKQAGAQGVEVRRDGTIVVLLRAPSRARHRRSIYEMGARV
jgi:hypothetical protein